jgi:hypothetical protein
VAQLWVQKSLMTGLVWMTKILTDPFHDIVLYHKAPLHLLRGELIDPMPHVRSVPDRARSAGSASESGSCAGYTVGLRGVVPPPTVGLQVNAASTNRSRTRRTVSGL